MVSHFSNINVMMEALTKYPQLLRQEMLNNMRLEWARYKKHVNPNGKNTKLATNTGDVVCWMLSFDSSFNFYLNNVRMFIVTIVMGTM